MSRAGNFQSAARYLFAAASRRGTGPSSSSSHCANPLSRACAAIQADVAKITSRASSGSHPVLQALRQEQTKFSCGTFASSPLLRGVPLTPAAPAPAAVNNVQARGAASTPASGTDDVEAEATTSAGGPRPRSRAPSSTAVGNDDDDPLPLNRFARGRMRQKSGQSHAEWLAEARSSSNKHQRDSAEMIVMDQASPLEFKLLAQESFLKKPADVISIPENIREVLYRFNWDKVLVDVRCSSASSKRGKIQTFTAMVAVGNLNGLFGLGLADAPVAMDAVGKAYMEAFSKLTFVPLYRGHTIYHRIDHDFHEMKMRLMPRHDGWGVKASNLVSELCGLVGIKNVSIKMVGRAKNKFYVAQCFQEALALQSTAHDGVEGTGTYVREVYSRSRGDKLPMGLQRGVHVS